MGLYPRYSCASAQQLMHEDHLGSTVCNKKLKRSM